MRVLQPDARLHVHPLVHPVCQRIPRTRNCASLPSPKSLHKDGPWDAQLSVVIPGRAIARPMFRFARCDVHLGIGVAAPSAADASLAALPRHPAPRRLPTHDAPPPFTFCGAARLANPTPRGVSVVPSDRGAEPATPCGPPPPSPLAISRGFSGGGRTRNCASSDILGGRTRVPFRFRKNSGGFW